jgi:hypothetical protein
MHSVRPPLLCPASPAGCRRRRLLLVLALAIVSVLSERLIDVGGSSRPGI